MKPRSLLVLLIAMQAGIAPAAWAQANADAQLRQLRLQVRQSMQSAQEAQRAADAAKAEAQATDAEKAKVEAALEAAERKRTGLAAALAQAGRDKEALEARVAQLEAALKKEQDELARTHSELNTQTAGRRAAETSFRKTSDELATCRKHNRRLVAAVDELLAAYRNKGVFAAFSEQEPFTGIGRVRLENLLEEYRDKAEDAKEPVAASPNR